MGFLGAKKSSDKSRREKKKPRDTFTRHGGRLTRQQIERYLYRVPLRPAQREYVKRVMERFDERHFSQGVTREEFDRGLREMEENPRDPLNRGEINRIKRYLNL